MTQVSVTKNCIHDIYTGKSLVGPICLLLSPKPSECQEHHTVTFFLSDTDVWSYGELDFDIRQTKLTAQQGGLLVRLVDFEVGWPCTVVVDHEVIKVKQIEIISQIEINSTAELTMEHHIYARITKPIFPLLNGILPFILGASITSTVGTLKPIIVQPVKKLTQGKITFYWISDGEFCCHAKFGINNQGKEVNVHDLYQVLKWEIIVDSIGRRKLIVTDYQHCKSFKHVLFHHSLGCKPSIRDVATVLSSGKDDVSVSNQLTTGFVKTLYNDESASMMSAINDHKHPILQVLLHAQVDSYTYAFISDAEYIWGAVFVNPVKPGIMKRNMIIQVDYYEILVVPQWRNYHSLCIHDWFVVDESLSSPIGAPKLVYTQLNQPHFQLSLDKVQSAQKPVVQVTPVTFGKCQIWDGSCVISGDLRECDGDLREYEIIRLNDFKWLTNGTIRILNFESITVCFLPLK